LDRFNLNLPICAWIALLNFVFANPFVCVAQSNEDEIEIPFVLTDQNNIVVSVLLNATDALDLMLHTAASDVTLTEEAVKKSTSIKFTGASKVHSWGGEAESRYSTGNQVQLGDLHRTKVVVWEDLNSGKNTDGKFGLDFFDGHIIEIDFDRSLITLHDKLPRKVAEFDRLKIENDRGNWLVKGDCVIDNATYSHPFLIHSGYSGGVLFDDAFARKVGADSKIRIVEESSLKDSFGNTIQIKKGILPKLVLGNSSVSDVPLGFFAGDIGNQKLSILGSEVLKQFHLVFDLAKSELYVLRRPN
jgi:hypothetical protein